MCSSNRQRSVRCKSVYQVTTVPEMTIFLPDFVVQLPVDFNFEGCHLVENFGFVEADQVVDDNVRGPKVVHHVTPNVDLAHRPIGRSVQNHPRLRPEQLVRQAEADLLEKGRKLQWPPLQSYLRIRRKIQWNPIKLETGPFSSFKYPEL